MDNKTTTLPQIDYDQFEADTRITNFDLNPELTAFAILWHSLGYGNDAIEQMDKTNVHRLTIPFVIKIIERLKADGRWTEDPEKQADYISIVTSLLMVKSANLTPDKWKELYDTVTDNVVASRIF